MVPTARARELEPEIRRILRDVEVLVSEPPDFDAAASRRTFSLRMSDLLSFLLLPPIICRLGKEAPGVALEITHLGPEATIDALERNAVELAVSTDLKTPKSIESAPLFQDRVVVVARGNHPARRGLSSIEGFHFGSADQSGPKPDRRSLRRPPARQPRSTPPHSNHRSALARRSRDRRQVRSHRHHASEHRPALPARRHACAARSAISGYVARVVDILAPATSIRPGDLLAARDPDRCGAGGYG